MHDIRCYSRGSRGNNGRLLTWATQPSGYIESWLRGISSKRNSGPAFTPRGKSEDVDVVLVDRLGNLEITDIMLVSRLDQCLD